MKKFASFILALTLVLSLASCTTVTGETKLPQDTAVGDGNTEQKTDVQDGTLPSDGGDAADTQPEPEPEPEPEPAEESIDETVLVDESGIKITAKELDPDNFIGPAVKLLIENDSSQDLTFQCRNVSVNGYMVDTMMSTDVVNGKKANDELVFMSSSLKECGIGQIADMEFQFHIFKTSDWEEYLDTDTVRLETSLADTYPYTYDDSGETVFDEQGVRVVVKGLSETDSLIGPGLTLYIENNGGSDVTVQTRDVSVNGFMLDALFSCDVAAGKKAVDTVTFMNSQLEENGIEKIESIELSLHIFNSATWDTIADSDPVTLSF